MPPVPRGQNPNAVIVLTCEELIRSFNPVTHSIDTHCSEKLGDVNSPEAKPENVLIQQIVYGWYKDRAVLKKFIDVFYGDNAARVLRVDMVLYTIFAYLAVFRIEEMGVRKFKELCLSQDPLKINTFVSYVFNKENLWNTIRAAFMKVRDLDYVENTMIPRVEKFIPDMMRFINELEANAASDAAAQAAKEEAKARGEAGLVKVAKKATTTPTSPRLTRTRVPVLPEPERISTRVEAKEVPGFLNNNTMESLEKERLSRTATVKSKTTAKYDEKLQFKFHETKGGRPIEDVAKEMEEKRTKDLKFDSTFYNKPPDFSAKVPDIRVNAAAILREDALYRKLQAKDAQILKNYEEELRDPTEYYLWQQELRKKDEIEKLEYVALRREQARQSAVEAQDAMQRQKEDNAAVANLMREQAEVIKREKELEVEIERLRNQQVVQQVIEVRETRPYEAVRKVVAERVDKGKKVREELEEARRMREEEIKLEEAVKNDKIRQLKALNTVHREQVKVFDPTDTAGIGLLDEMSYMEMKVRQEQERQKAEEAEVRKRNEIQVTKERRMTDLERRHASILKARELKASVNQEARAKAKAAAQREKEEQERARRAAKAKLDKVLEEKHAEKAAEQAALKAEQERIKRQQQYLGVAAGQVEQIREQQLQLARDRQQRQLELEAEQQRERMLAAMATDRQNKQAVERKQKADRRRFIAERDDAVEFEKKISVAKIKAAVVEKKSMFRTGQRQHEITHTVNVEHNPYGAGISEESLTKIRSQRLANSGFNALRSSSFTGKSKHVVIDE